MGPFSHPFTRAHPTKVKEILAHLAYEHPEDELVPGTDQAGRFAIAVAPPMPQDHSLGVLERQVAEGVLVE